MSKITGKEGLRFEGKCRAFDDEESFVKAVESGSIKQGEKTVVVLRYLGPIGGPGMVWSSRYGISQLMSRYAGNAETHKSDHGCWSGTGCCVFDGRTI